MAHVFRPEYTRPVPPHAERCTHKGRPAVRWRGRTGRPVVGVICAENPARCRVESPVWRLSYAGPDGRPAGESGYTDRAASEAKLAAKVKTAARVAAGLLPPQALAPPATLTELLDRFHAHVRHAGATVEGARRQWQRARDVCRGVGAVRPADLTPAAVLAWLGGLKAADRHHRKPFGPATAANYLSSAKSFTRWLAVVEKAEPVDHLSAVRVVRTSPPRRERRVLAPADLDRLLAAARRSRAAEFGLTGRERHALYLLASSTGLRAAELASLTPEGFDAKGMTVTIEAARAKNRRAEVLPVPAAVMAEVKNLFRRGRPVWPNRGRPSQAWWLRGAEMVRRDLARAGVAAAVGGRVFDFHSLRGQFATDLDRAGVTLAKAQKLMRHSTPALTAKHYTRPEADELAAEVAKLRRG